MAYFPGAKKLLLTPESANAPEMKGTPIQVILHSAVGSGSLYKYFQERSNLESHLWVGLDGRVEQYLTTARQADANYRANAWAISVESADNGDPDHFEWTDEQIDSFADIIVWAHLEFGIPITRCISWDSPGIGYHTMWGAPSNWTPVAKSCPGKARINQFNAVLAAANRKLKLQIEVSKPEVKMALDVNSEINLTGSATQFLKQRGAVPEVTADDKTPDLELGWFIQWGYINAVQQFEMLKALHAEQQRGNALMAEVLAELKNGAVIRPSGNPQ